MRTTINVPDDVYATAHSLALYEKISLGEAFARLIRQAGETRAIVTSPGSFPRFACCSDDEPITLEQTLAAEDDVF